jgi:hypothetical protein
MAASQGKIFFDDAPKTPTRGNASRKPSRADRKQQQEVAPISSPPTSPYSSKSQKRDLRQSKNALKEMPQVMAPLAAFAKPNGVDAVLARTLSKTSLANKENDTSSRNFEFTSVSGL